jgi:hypothetical protein
MEEMTSQDRMMLAVPVEMTMRILGEDEKEITLTATEAEWICLTASIDLVAQASEAAGEEMTHSSAIMLAEEMNDLIFHSSEPRIVAGEPKQLDRKVAIKGPQGTFFSATTLLARALIEVQTDNLDSEIVRHLSRAWATFKGQWIEIEPMFGGGLD